jgi:hypothetical protein
MKPGWEESEYVFCDLQHVARYLFPDHIQIWCVLHGTKDLQKLVQPSRHGYGE